MSHDKILCVRISEDYPDESGIIVPFDKLHLMDGLEAISDFEPGSSLGLTFLEMTQEELDALPEWG